MKILSLDANSTKFCIRTKSVGLWRARNAKTLHPKWWWVSPGGVAPWLVRGPPKTGLAASKKYKK